MSIQATFGPALPEGWHYPDSTMSQSLHAELHRELPPGHLLTGCEVETFAWTRGGTDDVLFRHAREPQRFTMIHLTWLGRTEINAKHPSVVFDGSFEEFIVGEERLYGLKPKPDA